jgi:hypothetical protein
MVFPAATVTFRFGNTARVLRGATLTVGVPVNTALTVVSPWTITGIASAAVLPIFVVTVPRMVLLTGSVAGFTM